MILAADVCDFIIGCPSNLFRQFVVVGLQMRSREVMLRIDLEILSSSISSMWDSGLQACSCRQPALHCSYSLSPSLTYGYSGHIVRHPPAIFLALLSPAVGYYVAMGVYFLHFDCQFSARPGNIGWWLDSHSQCYLFRAEFMPILKAIGLAGKYSRLRAMNYFQLRDRFSPIEFVFLSGRSAGPFSTNAMLCSVRG